jgi:hypothetical protein
MKTALFSTDNGGIRAFAQLEQPSKRGFIGPIQSKVSKLFLCMMES